MQTWTLLSPGDPAQRTGGYLYNARLAEALTELGHQVRVVPVEGAWPLGPVAAAPELPSDGVLLADGLLWTALRSRVPDAALQRVVVLVHSVLAAEGGAELARLEAEALAGVGAVVATGGPTERDLAAMGVSSVCIEPGTDPSGRATAPGLGRLLALGTVTPRKGLLRLLDALEGVEAPWTLDIVGSETRDVEHAASVRRRAATFGGRVRFRGELDGAGVAQALEGADVLVHVAHYEAYGMALAEAMARGVPVVCTAAGAAEGGGAIVVDAGSLGDRLQHLLSNPQALADASDLAWRRGRCLPSWSDVARRFAMLEAGRGGR